MAIQFLNYLSLFKHYFSTGGLVEPAPPSKNVIIVYLQHILLLCISITNNAKCDTLLILKCFQYYIILYQIFQLFNILVFTYINSFLTIIKYILKLTVKL